MPIINKDAGKLNFSMLGRASVNWLFRNLQNSNGKVKSESKAINTYPLITHSSRLSIEFSGSIRLGSL
jgi:hypothetical protein